MVAGGRPGNGMATVKFDCVQTYSPCFGAGKTWAWVAVAAMMTSRRSEGTRAIVLSMPRFIQPAYEGSGFCEGKARVPGIVTSKSTAPPMTDKTRRLMDVLAIPIRWTNFFRPGWLFRTPGRTWENILWLA